MKALERFRKLKLLEMELEVLAENMAETKEHLEYRKKKLQ